jgi:hypothetical protein
MANQTTLTLDDDVAEKLEAEAQKSGKTPEIVANETLRNALGRQVPLQQNVPYRVNAKRMEMLPGYRLEEEAEAQSSGQPLEAVLDETLRRGLGEASVPPFRVTPKEMGMRPGLDLECVAELLDEVEGPMRR